jgi:hypothetical protein
VSKTTDEHLALVWRAISEHNPEAKRSMRAIESQLRQARSDVAKYKPLEDILGASSVIPFRYQSAFFALSIVAHHSARRPADGGAAPGKPESRMPRHDTDAYREFRNQQRYLGRQAEWIERVLAAVVDKECVSDKCQGVVVSGLYCPTCTKKKRDRRDARLQREANAA